MPVVPYVRFILFVLAPTENDLSFSIPSIVVAPRNRDCDVTLQSAKQAAHGFKLLGPSIFISLLDLSPSPLFNVP